MFRAVVYVTLKPGVLDAQGSAILDALHSLEYKSVDDVRVGKYIEIALDVDSPAEGERQLKEMCQRLLANPVIENYRYEVVDAG